MGVWLDVLPENVSVWLRPAEVDWFFLVIIALLRFGCIETEQKRPLLGQKTSFVTHQ
jgi:hypothetical protein